MSHIQKYLHGSQKGNGAFDNERGTLKLRGKWVSCSGCNSKGSGSGPEGVEYKPVKSKPKH